MPISVCVLNSNRLKSSHSVTFEVIPQNVAKNFDLFLFSFW